MGIPLNEVEMDLSETTLTIDVDEVLRDAETPFAPKVADNGQEARSRRDLERYMEERALERELKSWY